MEGKKILLVGTINNFCLETSYASAAKSLGFEVRQFDPRAETNKHVKLGRVGKKMNDFLPVEAWVRKMNRELVVLAKKYRPDVLILFGTARIFYGSLITIRLLVPPVKIVWVWPDTPMNLDSNNLDNAGVFDLSAVYSYSAVHEFEKLGFKNCSWVPLAGDTFLHGMEVRESDEFDCDISFVGMWRPERERMMQLIVAAFRHLRIEIHGNYWQRDCADKSLLALWKGDGFYGKALGAYFNRSRININVIDDTNYPAANMRFFEIPVAGGLQVASACPEQENDFRDMESVVYFNNENELVEKISLLINNNQQAQSIRRSARRIVAEQHTYVHRLKNITKLLNL